MQREEAVTITGPEQAGDGETFLPVEVVATGEVGWVRQLAIDPRSRQDQTAAPAATDAGAQDRAQRRQQRQAREAAVVIPEPAAPEEVAAPEEAPRRVELAPVPLADAASGSGGDLDCADFSSRDFPVPASDPHGLDGDGDGIGCES